MTFKGKPFSWEMGTRVKVQTANLSLPSCSIPHADWITYRTGELF